MSYDICYDRCFIKSGLGFTPMWLVGSNNCTESVYGADGKWHERRERHWSPLCNMAGVSEEELMAKAHSYVPSLYNQHFKRGGKWVDDDAWLRFVENGIKKAVTIEQLLKFTHRSKMRCSVHTWVGDDSRHELETGVCTTEEYDVWLRKAKEFIASRHDEWGPWFCVDMGMREPLGIAPPPKEMQGKVAAKYKNCYVVRVDIHGICYSKRVEDAVIWNSLEEAKKSCEGHGIQVTYVSGDTVLSRKGWKWTVRVASGQFEGRYVSRLTPSHMYFDRDARYAKRFPSKAAAEKYYAKLKPRYKVEFEAVEVTQC